MSAALHVPYYKLICDVYHTANLNVYDRLDFITDRTVLIKISCSILYLIPTTDQYNHK